MTRSGCGLCNVARRTPAEKTQSVPGAPMVQVSSRVSGRVAITATRSRGVVTAAKSMCTSSSESVARENGCLRTMWQSDVSQRA